MFKKLSAIQSIALGFAIIILVGALLLMLPACNRDGQPIPFVHALFMASSATCVTGLTLYDTYSQFTMFGQIVLLSLIQIGGLGFMTVAVFFFFVFNKNIGLKERVFLTTAVSSLRIGGVVRLIKRILIGTFFIEMLGACLLATQFCPQFGIQGIWFSIFHAVSAFCNAGFDLMGIIQPSSSLMLFYDNKVVNFTIMGLIVSGGIGFVIWDDLKNKGLKWKSYELHTKVILSFTLGLIVIPSLLFFFTERQTAMSGLTNQEALMASFFHSISSRTAGFNTVDMSQLSLSGSLLTSVLMFIGAGSGSTAGGIKVGTFAAMLLSVLAYIRGKKDIEIFQRRLDLALIHQAFCCTLFYLFLALTSIFLILWFQPFKLEDVMFEVFSALGTVGISRGITGDLNIWSQLIIIMLMYSGRVGSLAILVSLSSKRKTGYLRNPVDRIIIG